MTYCDNTDIKQRLDLTEQQYDQRNIELDSVRKRANRWIVVWFARYDFSAPEPDSLSGELMLLRDIEADYASYLYWRDYHEWMEHEGDTKKRSYFKIDAKENLQELLKSQAGDKFFETGGEI